MKKLYFLIFIANFIISTQSYGQTPINDPHWQLVWQDNFNSLDLNIWEIANNFDHYGEPQMYRTNNVTVLNGNLVLKAKKENYLGHAYTSGWVSTKQAYNIQYGFIESSIKLPYGYGFWPAFWTFKGNGVIGSNAAEIDIFEMVGHQPSNIVGTNIHKAYCDCENYSCACDFLYDQECPDYNNTILCYGQDLVFANFTYTDWHIYGIEWSPTKIIWYIDGCPVRTMENHGIIDPVQIILNFAIEPRYLPNSSTPFPSDMLVNYVKVYKLINDCNTIINACNYNFLTYDNKVKKEIVFGGSGCTNIVPSNSSIYLRASDGILINGDFTVPLGTQLYLDVNPCY